MTHKVYTSSHGLPLLFLLIGGNYLYDLFLINFVLDNIFFVICFFVFYTLCNHATYHLYLIYCYKKGDTNTSVSNSSTSVCTNKTKIDTTVELIKKNPNNKFIIFSAWDQTFYPIRMSLEENNIKFVEVKGSISDRKKSIDSYKKKEDCNVIFLNSKFNGAGINLQETTDIIMYHRLHDYQKTQVIGRANRIGRLESLNVHHLQI